MIFRTLMKLTAADLIDLQRLTESWEAFTTTWTSDGTPVSQGNALLTGRKLVVGKTVWNYIDLTMGSTTTFGTGNYFFSLSASVRSGAVALGSIYMVDFSAGTNRCGVPASFSASLIIGVTSADQTVAATIPHTWAVSDRIAILTQFEVA